MRIMLKAWPLKVQLGSEFARTSLSVRSDVILVGLKIDQSKVQTQDMIKKPFALQQFLNNLDHILLDLTKTDVLANSEPNRTFRG